MDSHTSVRPHSECGMKRISVLISERQYEQFKGLGSAEERPYSELIREALSQYLRRRGAWVAKPGRLRAFTRKRP